MKTILQSSTSEISISDEGPFIIIGERINPTGNKRLSKALTEGDLDYIRELARTQVASGADVLDVNVGVPGLDDTALLPEIVEAVASEVDVPICIDTPNSEALASALSKIEGKALVNSVNGEKSSLENVLPLVKDHGAAVIGLTMDDEGIPSTSDGRVKVAGTILEQAAKLGINEEDVVIDPLVLTVGADHQAAANTIAAIEGIHGEFGVNINIGASNVSFGLPERMILNQAFVALAMGAGATCAITNASKMTRTIRATDLLMGKDEFGARYIQYFRSQQTD
ncbi:MAG: dihydropteroate synthase [Anaerolineales bacterium]